MTTLPVRPAPGWTRGFRPSAERTLPGAGRSRDLSRPLALADGAALGPAKAAAGVVAFWPTNPEKICRCCTKSISNAAQPRGAWKWHVARDVLACRHNVTNLRTQIHEQRLGAHHHAPLFEQVLAASCVGAQFQSQLHLFGFSKICRMRPAHGVFLRNTHLC